MNRLITLLLLCFTVSTVIAQKNAQIKVEYTERYKNWTGANKKEKMILLANGDISHYYNPMTLVVDSMLSTPQGTVQFNSMVEAANAIASEHLEIVTANPFDVMTRIKNAGAIFIGEYSSEPLGDYFAGPNHVLPTNGTAKFFSPLSVDDFIKKSSIIYYSREALEEVHEDIESFAKSEQLTAHANSIAVRFE
jgi:hypothetical protein